MLAEQTGHGPDVLPLLQPVLTVTVTVDVTASDPTSSPDEVDSRETIAASRPLLSIDGNPADRGRRKINRDRCFLPKRVGSSLCGGRSDLGCSIRRHTRTSISIRSGRSCLSFLCVNAIAQSMIPPRFPGPPRACVTSPSECAAAILIRGIAIPDLDTPLGPLSASRLRLRRDFHIGS